MATAAPEHLLARLGPAALLWVAVGGWAFERLPPDGSAGVVLGLTWAALLLLRWLPWARWGLPVPRIAGLCCPAPQPRLSDVAMGWMMGTLWWHADGCLGVRGPLLLWVLLHLAGMAALLVSTRALARRLSGPQLQAVAAGAAALALLTLWLRPLDAFGTLAVMGLFTLAWAMEPVQRSPGVASAAHGFMWLAGPPGLWLILAQWPTRGPDALWLALMLLAAGGVLVWTAHRLRMAFTSSPLEIWHEQH